MERCSEEYWIQPLSRPYHSRMGWAWLFYAHYVHTSKFYIRTCILIEVDELSSLAARWPWYLASKWFWLPENLLDWIVTWLTSTSLICAIHLRGQSTVSCYIRKVFSNLCPQMYMPVTTPCGHGPCNCPSIHNLSPWGILFPLNPSLSTHPFQACVPPWGPPLASPNHPAKSGHTCS